LSVKFLKKNKKLNMSHNLPRPINPLETIKEIGAYAFAETLTKGREPYPEESEIYLTMIDMLSHGKYPSTDICRLDSALKTGFLQARIANDMENQLKKQNINLNE
jgi:hypothetical protein